MNEYKLLQNKKTYVILGYLEELGVMTSEVG
jgi:hypothetical protein